MNAMIDWRATSEPTRPADWQGQQPLEQPLRLLLADDHTVFRRGLRDVLEEEPDMRVVAEAANGVEAVQRAKALWPHSLDLVVMDVDMPHQDGTSAANQIARELPGLPVVMLTVSTLDGDLYGAARAGVAGFLSKSLSSAAILRALRDFRREGALPMSPTTAAKALTYLQRLTAQGQTERPARAQRTESWDQRQERSLTPREREVLALMASGARDREIAVQLILTESTVKSHVQSILRKLGARNRTEAVARMQRGAV